jgi:Putative exonuclease SbcCD, C subunit
MIEQLPLSNLNLINEQDLAAQVALLQTIGGGPAGYRLRRIILTSFWLYGHLEIEIPHGRLFLAGENASGKSTVLTAALPLALDGDLHARRLDTFGGRDRRIDYYVLGSTDSATPFEHTRRTSYIALEFEWCDQDHPPIASASRQLWEHGDFDRARFYTIGLCLAGNVNASESIRPLRFVITDGSRLEYDFSTVVTDDGKQHALSQKAFKPWVEAHGIVSESQVDYARHVARELFGYENVDDFQNLINLMLLLRRPNLSSELSFSKVHEYLKLALRRVPTETMLHVTSTIEQIDTIQKERERLQAANESVGRLDIARQDLANARVLLHAYDYLEAHSRAHSAGNQVERTRRDLANAERDYQNANDRLRDLSTEIEALRGQISAIESSEGLQVVQKLTTLQDELQRQQQQFEQQQQILNAARQSVQATTNRLERLQDQARKGRDALAEQLRILHERVSGVATWPLAQHTIAAASDELGDRADLAADSPKLNAVLDLLATTLDERLALAQKIEHLFADLEHSERELELARQRESAAEHAMNDAYRHYQNTREQANERQIAIATQWETLAQQHPALNELDEWIFARRLSDALRRTSEEEGAPDRLIEILDQHERDIQYIGDQVTATLDQRLASGRQTLIELRSQENALRQQLKQVQQEFDALLLQPDLHYPAPVSREQARAALEEAGIIAYPLYQLITFTPDCPDDLQGRLERMLSDAGLIDALLVSPAEQEHAQSIIADIDASAIWLSISMNDATASLPNWLTFDQESAAESASWLPIVTDRLSQIGAYVHFDADGTWLHGALGGHASTTETASYIGTERRQRMRRAAIAAVEEQRDNLQRDLDDRAATSADLTSRIDAWQQANVGLRRVLQDSQLAATLMATRTAIATWTNAQSRYSQTQEEAQHIWRRHRTLSDEITWESASLGDAAHDLATLRIAIQGMLQMQQQRHTFAQLLEARHENQIDQQRAEKDLEHERASEIRSMQAVDAAQFTLARKRAEIDELTRASADTNAAQVLERLQSARARLEIAATEQGTASDQRSRSDERCNTLRQRLNEQTETWEQAQAAADGLHRQFVASVREYPTPMLDLAQPLLDGDPAMAATQLLEQSESSADRQDLDATERARYNDLALVFNEVRADLVEYSPTLDTDGNMIFMTEERATPIQMLARLDGELRVQQMLLSEQERKLFEDFLLHEMSEALRQRILEAEEWVIKINEVLANLPLVGEHYSLDWKPIEEPDTTRLGQYLARYAHLLRKPAAMLTNDEVSLLMDAFRQEIVLLRERILIDQSIGFTDALEMIVDYREWFHFNVYVTSPGSHRQRLTDRLTGTRSGAERLFALYVPLFAALAALYNGAASGAPRLLALDEAFDKSSVINTRRILHFLVSQDFQWIMTGPRIDGNDPVIPACARYLMLHEKGSDVATAQPAFWAHTPENDQDEVS